MEQLVTPDTSARVDRILSEADGADAILATTASNVAYLLGRELASDAMYAATMGGTWVVASHAGIRVVAAAMDLPLILGIVPSEHVIAHGTWGFSENPPEHAVHKIPRQDRGAAVRTLLDQLGGSARFLADGLDREALREVEERLNGTEVRVSSLPFLAARSRKDPWELDLLKEANRAAEEAVEEALGRLRPGVSEREISAAISAGMLSRGAQPQLNIVGFGEHGAIAQDYASARCIGEGEVVRCDVNCTVNGYNADLARSAVIGPPSEALERTYAAILAGADAAASEIRPGVTTRELWEQAVESTRRAGLVDYDGCHCGHGIGLEVYEPPFVRSDGEGRLAPGMVLTIETLWLELGKVGLQIEDSYLVTENGAERLAKGPRDLVIL